MQKLLILIASSLILICTEPSLAQPLDNHSSRDTKETTFDKNKIFDIMNSAQQDLIKLSSGKAPSNAARSIGDLADGGSIIYENDNYQITNLKRMSFLKGERGWLQGPEVVFLDKRFEKIGRVRFLASERNTKGTRDQNLSEDLLIANSEETTKEFKKLAELIHTDISAIMSKKAPKFTKLIKTENHVQEFSGKGYSIFFYDKMISVKPPSRLYGVKVTFSDSDIELMNIEVKRE